MKKIIFPLITVLLSYLLVGCGGGGDSSSSSAPIAEVTPVPVAPPVVPPTTVPPISVVLQPSSTLANMCQAPRSGTNPYNSNKPYPDKQGTTADEKAWLRSWFDETYLWYDEIPALNAASYSTTVDYFYALKTPTITTSGKPKDNYHYAIPSAEWDASSQQSVALGYGITWARTSGTALPRRRVVTIVEPGSPADLSGVRRGDELVTVDDADYLNGTGATTIDKLYNGLFPTVVGDLHNLGLLRNGVLVTATMKASNVVSTSVQNVKTLDTATGKVGYMTFSDHSYLSEPQLINAVSTLKTAGITDLVLDLRYNGGGLVFIASEMAYMIAGPQATAGKIFEQTMRNNKTFPLTPFPFYSASNNNQPLPNLGLKRVTILTSPSTCSASESIINGLRGVDIEVNLIGGTTCGKPYGFTPTPNCGTTYLAIQFKGVNNKGYGDYADGMAPTCAVADDYTHALGDPAERQLAAALSYRASKACPAASSSVMLQGESLASSLRLERPIAKEIAIYSSPR